MANELSGFTENVKNPFRHELIHPLSICADIVNLSRHSVFQYVKHRSRMIFDVNPIPYLFAVAI